VQESLLVFHFVNHRVGHLGGLLGLKIKLVFDSRGTFFLPGLAKTPRFLRLPTIGPENVVPRILALCPI
jgi:hypothetical protein